MRITNSPQEIGRKSLRNRRLRPRPTFTSISSGRSPTSRLSPVPASTLSRDGWWKRRKFERLPVPRSATFHVGFVMGSARMATRLLIPTRQPFTSETKSGVTGQSGISSGTPYVGHLTAHRAQTVESGFDGRRVDTRACILNLQTAMFRDPAAARSANSSGRRR